MEDIEELKKKANMGDLDAEDRLADCYFYGKGVEINKKEAFKLWKDAALMHQVRGEQAYTVVLYEKCANGGDAEAQCDLAALYAQGEGVEVNKEKAIELWTKAAEQGYGDGQFELGNCYIFGDGIAQNLEKGVELLKKAAAQGSARFESFKEILLQTQANPDCQKILAFYRQNGIM